MLSSKHNLIRIIGASFIMIIFTLAAKPAQAIWYDESWQYRQTINITNGSSSALTNYQVPVVINTAGLIAAGKLQNDCDDLRFTDVAQASLPYWIDSETGPGCNSATTKIWVKVPVIPPSGASVLYVYYANSSAVAATSYPNTMAWGEIGAATAGATWRQISLLQSYSNPVIVSTYQEGANGPAGTDLPVSVRLKDVTSHNFKVTLQNAALVPATPATDLIYYLVINQGQYKLLGAGDLRLDGNNLTTNKVGSWSGGAAGWAAGKAESQIISPVFSAGALDPMTVLHQVMSYNDSSWIKTWVSETDDYDDPVRPGGFQISLNGAEVRNTHGAEQIGWIGINPGASATAGLLKFETKLTSNVITGHDDAVVTQNFARTTYTTPPLVIYKQQEMNSTDGGWAVITNVTTAAVTGHIEEDKRLDPERSHPGEIVGFLAVSAPGKFTLRKFAAEEPVLSAPQNEEIGLSPVGYWPLDDGAGPTVDDQSAGNYDGTIIGATWADAQECQVGQCLSFDGTGDYINVPHVAALNGNSALTYELWFNARTFTKTHNQLIGKSIHDGGTGRSQMGIWLDNAGKLTGRAQLVAASSTINYATSVPPNSWHQAALVFSGTALNLYLDGEEVASSTFGLNSLVSTIDPLRFGCDYERCGAPDPDYLFDGWLDEIRIYNYARSTGQIESDYLLGLMPGNLTLGAPQNVSHLAGSWYYLVGVWDINRALEGGGDYVLLYVNSAESIASPQQPGTPSVIPSTFGLGQFAGESQFNGTIAGRILNYPLTSVQVANLYNAGSGREQTFAVEPDTVWLADASGDSTDAVFWPRGQAVLSTTGNLVTTAETLSKRVWRNNERVWISDGTGFGRAAFISATPVASAFSIAVDDGSGLPVTDLENVGRSLNFGGIGYVGLGNFGLFEMSTGDLSMDIWVKTEETGKQAIFNKGGGTNSIPGYGLGLSSGGILTSQLSSGTARQEITGVAPVADGRWHHLAVVWDRSGFTNLYLDGQLDKTAATSFNGTGIVNSAQNLIIGKNSHENTAFFSGQVAAARLYHVAITSAEVKWLAEHPQVSTSEVEAAVNSITKVYTSTTGPVTAGTLVDVPVLSAVGLAAGQTVWLKDSATAQSENAILAAVSLGQVTVAVLNNDYAANSQLSYSDLVSYSAFYNGDAGDLSIYQNDGAVVAASYTQSAFISKNLLSDVGMENGGIGGWNGVDTELSKNINLARNDEQCLQIKSTGGTPSYAASELIAVAPLTDYCLTGWQRAGADSFARIEVYDSAETFPPIWSSSANSVASWNFVNGCFTVPLAESGLVVRLSTGADSADLAYYDQFEILPQLIKNPGLGDLDSGNVPDGWTKNSTPTLIKEVGGGHSVGDAVSISGSADSTKSLSQTVNYTLGQRYTFNFWVKRLAGAGKPLVDLGGLADSWQGGSTRVYPENMINGTWYLWTFTSWPLQAPTDRTISLAVNNAATKIVYDDVSVTELDVVTPATNTPGSYQHSLGTGHYNDERGAFLIDGADKLMYPTNGRIIGDKGTVLFWVKPQFLNSSRKLFSVYTDSNDYFSVGIGADNKSYADLNGTVMAIGDTPFSTVDQWYHLAVTWQYGVDLTLYVNNVDEDSYSNSATLSLPTNLELGSENSILQADSFLDDVYLFREVITLDDIETIYGSSQTLNWRKWKTRDLSCGVNYTGQVKAVNRDGDETEWIQALSVTAPCPTYCVDADDCSVGFICLYDVCVPENKCEPH